MFYISYHYVYFSQITNSILLESYMPAHPQLSITSVQFLSPSTQAIQCPPDFRDAMYKALFHRPLTTHIKFRIFLAKPPRAFFSSSRPNMASAISAAIAKDHRELETYYNNILEAPDNDTATRWQNQFTWELARHSIAEELVVYPAFEKHLGDNGHIMAEKDREEHQVVSRSLSLLLRVYSLPDPNSSKVWSSNANTTQQVKDKLKIFQNLDAGTPQFIPTLVSLMDDLAQHMKEEENEDLPALDAAISKDDAKGLEKEFRRTKSFVPSRSHPLAPNRPPFETVAGLMAAPIDRLGDMLRKFPDPDEARV
jgi:hemerythrin-like domain-containing protein